ncbi:MAG: enoyl-CoA hydratase-related protein [Actinomycetota bacterium]
MTAVDATVRRSFEDGVLTLVIANEARANALTAGMLEELASALGRPPDGTRVVLLRGAGERHFSAGVDLNDAPTPATLREGERRLGAVVDAVHACPAPVIAVLNGSAHGGALELAASCDWRIARAGAELAMPAARIGVAYTPRGVQTFATLLGPARTAALFLTGVTVDADRALAIGLVDAVHDPAALDDAARHAALQVAAMAPLAVRGTLATLRALVAGGITEEDRAAAEAWRDRAWASADLAEGLAAFRERRAPRFTGE